MLIYGAGVLFAAVVSIGCVLIVAASAARHNVLQNRLTAKVIMLRSTKNGRNRSDAHTDFVSSHNVAAAANDARNAHIGR